jgi:hypothetical protein
VLSTTKITVPITGMVTLKHCSGGWILKSVTQKLEAAEMRFLQSLLSIKHQGYITVKIQAVREHESFM